MRDDFLSNEWTLGRGNMVEGIRSFLRAVGAGFARLQAHQFDAPWRRAALASRPRRPVIHQR